MRVVVTVLISRLLLAALSALPAEMEGQRRSDQPSKVAQQLVLQRAQLIRCTYYEKPQNNRRQVSFTRPTDIQHVCNWILQYAWPPIDRRDTGAVIPRGGFDIYENANDPEPAFRVSVFAITTRAQPQIVHVSDADWQKFLSLIPSK